MGNKRSLLKQKLATLLPPSVLDDSEDAAFELVRAVLVRANYISAIRQRLGWCGIHEVISPNIRTGTVTTRINDRPGVYGVLPLESTSGRGACFSLCYFPSPDEDLVESFSVEAGIQILQPDFLDKVRSFATQLGFANLFHLGYVEAYIHEDTGGVFLALTANDRLSWSSSRGIVVKNNQGLVEAVAPGGIDQDLAAREIAMPFFRALAASFSYTLASAPAVLYTQQRMSLASSPLVHTSREHRLTLGYFADVAQAEGFDWEEPPEIRWDPSKPVPKIYEGELWWTTDFWGVANGLDKGSMGMVDKPRFILLTGFLGAGKTSFLDNFIQAQAANNNLVAVIQNEIGERGLDAKLLNESYAVTQMDEGCVCCSLAGNLRSALVDIMARFQPDFIVLETTGLANPANMLAEIDDLSDILEFGSVTTMVDSLAGVGNLERFEVARAQIRLADLILVNKSDLSDPSQLDFLTNEIRSLNPVADIHRTTYGDVNPAILYGTNFQLPPKRPLISPMEDGQGGTHLNDLIETRLIDFEAPLDKDTLLKAIVAGADDILRVKGIVEFTDDPDPVVFQYSQGGYDLAKTLHSDTAERFLVIIGRSLNRHFADRFSLNTTS